MSVEGSSSADEPQRLQPPNMLERWKKAYSKTSATALFAKPLTEPADSRVDQCLLLSNALSEDETIFKVPPPPAPHTLPSRAGIRRRELPPIGGSLVPIPPASAPNSPHSRKQPRRQHPMASPPQPAASPKPSASPVAAWQSYSSLLSGDMTSKLKQAGATIAVCNQLETKMFQQHQALQHLELRSSQQNTTNL